MSRAHLWYIHSVMSPYDCVFNILSHMAQVYWIHVYFWTIIWCIFVKSETQLILPGRTLTSSKRAHMAHVYYWYKVFQNVRNDELLWMHALAVIHSNSYTYTYTIKWISQDLFFLSSWICIVIVYLYTDLGHNMRCRSYSRKIVEYEYDFYFNHYHVLINYISYQLIIVIKFRSQRTVIAWSADTHAFQCSLSS